MGRSEDGCMTPGTKVRGIGRVPRGISAGLFLLVTISVFMNSRGGFEPGALLVVVPATAALVRSLFIRMTLAQSTIRLTSWFRNYSFPISELEDCVRVPYAGLMSRGITLEGPTGMGLTMLEFDFASRSSREFPATIMAWSTAIQAEAQVKAFLVASGIEVGDPE